MKPAVGDNVKIFIHTSVVEGKVHRWDKKIILASDDQSTFMVITKPKDIFMYKIIKNQKYQPPPLVENNSVDLEVEPVHYSPPEEEEVPDTTPLPIEPNLRAKSLAELHQLKIEEERKMVAQKLKEHHIDGFKRSNYELPGFFKK